MTSTIYIYRASDGQLVDKHTADTEADCVAWAEASYSSDEFHYSACYIPQEPAR